jgi:hypothetical protein
MEDRFTADIVEFDRTHQMWSFRLDSLPILLLFVRSSFFNRVTLQLMTSLTSFLLFGVSLTLLALSCLLPLASPAEIKWQHLSFVGLMIF